VLNIVTVHATALFSRTLRLFSKTQDIAARAQAISPQPINQSFYLI